MKIKRTDAHDRFTFLKQQSDYISQGIEECKTKNELGKALLSHAPYMYVFAHKREIGMDERFSLLMSGFYSSMEEVPTVRLLWQPRLSKPTPQENSMLFKVFPNNDTVKIFWVIPQKELWEQYEKGKMIESEIIYTSIQKFKNDPKSLGFPETDDLNDESVKNIYQNVDRELRRLKQLKSDLSSPISEEWLRNPGLLL